MNLDLREGIDFSIWLLGSFEPETVRCYQRIVKSGDVVLDIGANIGANALLLAKAVGSNGKVYAFEPTDFAFTKLTKIVRSILVWPIASTACSACLLNMKLGENPLQAFIQVGLSKKMLASTNYIRDD